MVTAPQCRAVDIETLFRPVLVLRNKYDLAHQAISQRDLAVVRDILQAEGLELTSDNYKVAEGTLSWLHDEGFLRCLGSGRPHDPTGVSHLEFRKSRLTVVGLNALNQTVDISGQSGREKAGDLLVDQVKKSTSDARSAVIGEIIGAIIGAASKTIFQT